MRVHYIEEHDAQTACNRTHNGKKIKLSSILKNVTCLTCIGKLLEEGKLIIKERK